MSAKDSDFKRSTGYYTLTVLRANGLSPSLNNIYVKVQVKGVIQRTNVTGDVSESWNECFPIRAPNGRIVVSFTLMKKVPVFPYFRPVGTRDVQMTELVALCKGKEETELNLYLRKRSSSRRLVIKLTFSDVKTNADVAMTNLLPLINDNGGIAFKSQGLEDTEAQLDQAISQGKGLMQSSLGNAIGSALPNIDTFVETVDNIVQAHPLLNISWQLISVAYKAASAQNKLDERINRLLRSAAFAFSFAQDASLLNEGDDRLSSIRRIILQLMGEIIDCSLFIREYARTTFLKRLLTQTSDTQQTTRIEKTLQELRENLEKGVDLQKGLFLKDIAGGFSPRATENVLKEIRVASGFTLLNLREMEGSDHQECMSGTRTEWIDKIVSWLLSDADTEKNALWVNGIPGSGKSTLIQSVMKHPKIDPFLVSHIIFKRENAYRHEILSLIAYRLAESNAAVASAIAKGLKKRISGPRQLFTNLIRDPLKEAEAAGNLTEPIVIILDALDEYGNSETRASLLQLLSNDFAYLPRCVRFLISSRPEVDLVKALSQSKHIQEAKLEIDTDESRRDVSLYITTQLQRLVPAKSASGSKWEEMMIIFGKAADGLFIWAAVAVQLIRSADRPYKKICALANNEEQLTLDDLYKKALASTGIDWKNGDSKEYFAMLFTLILPNRGLLTIELFDLLFVLEDDTSETFLVKLQSFLSFGRSKSVQIYHKTLTDFITSPDRRPNEPWYIDLRKWNCFVASHCFIAMKDLHFDMCGAVTGSGDSEIGIDDIQPHIIYASLYWADHLKDAEFSDETLKHLRTFLDTGLLYWFEVLILAEELSRVAYQALSNAIDWVSGHSTSTTLFLMDARSIVSQFSKAIAKSPVLIYTTALPLTFSTNSVTHQYHAFLADYAKSRMSRIDSEIIDGQFDRGRGLQAFQGCEYVRSAIFSADSHYVFSTSSSSSSIDVWNAHTGEKIRCFSGHSGTVLDLAVSPEGDITVSASMDKMIRLWDTETGTLIGSPLEGHWETVACVAFSPNGKNIASGSDDRTVRLWSVETGQVIGKPFTGHNALVKCVAYSPDGKRLASWSYDERIIIWDIESSTSVVTIDNLGVVYSLAFSLNGWWLASGIHGGVQIWNTMTGEMDGEPFRGHTGNVYTICFSPDSSRVISGSSDGTVIIWNVETREEAMPPLQHLGTVYSVAYSQDGSRILSAGGDDITIWNSVTGKPIIGTNRPTYNFRDIAPDGSNLNLDDCQLFEGWCLDNGGWVRGASGEYRVLLPGYMRKLVHPVDEGVYVHRSLRFDICNAAAEEFKGFTFTS